MYAARMLIGLTCFFASTITQASQADVSETDEARMMSSYDAAMADGDETAAVKYVLDFAEKTHGENSPRTVDLTHRYGHLLYQNGEYREATEVLKKALERSIATFGESGGEAYEINMSIGYAYSGWRSGLSLRTKYFDRALAILRERGERETIAYVTTLIDIAVNLMENGGLKGTVTAEFGSNADRDDYFLDIEHEYRNYFHTAEKYILEATELGKNLENVDEYISSIIAIAQAKLNVMDAADRAAVPLGIRGRISAAAEEKLYDREEERLTAAIDELSRDIEKNRSYLTAANNVRMDIAWMGEDAGRMAAMCTDGILNSASEYHPDRLFAITENGDVLAPNFSFRISTNVFKTLRSREEDTRNINGIPVKKPHFIPVCIDGRLMAALINGPRITIEELE